MVTSLERYWQHDQYHSRNQTDKKSNTKILSEQRDLGVVFFLSRLLSVTSGLFLIVRWEGGAYRLGNVPDMPGTHG
jgi:hypothetical protein